SRLVLQKILDNQTRPQKFVKVGWLGDIPGNLQVVVFQSRRRPYRRTHEDHRHAREAFGGADSFEDLDAVVFRQAEVYDREVRNGACAVLPIAAHELQGAATVVNHGQLEIQ